MESCTWDKKKHIIITIVISQLTFVENGSLHNGYSIRENVTLIYLMNNLET